MAGDAIHCHVRGLMGDQIFLQIMVTIARGSAHTPAAHTIDNSKPYSRTCHAARHDVNDPSRRAPGATLGSSDRGRSHHGVLFHSHANGFGGRHRAPPASCGAHR